MALTTTQALGLGVLLLTVLGGWRFGGRPERIAVCMIAAAWFATPLVQSLGSWTSPQFGPLLVDSLLLAGLAALGRASGRLWLLCASGLQACAVLIHLLYWINPAQLYRAFYYSEFSIQYFVSGALLGGYLVEIRPMRLQRLRAS